MIMVKNVLNGFDFKFLTVLIIISILYSADGISVEYPDVPESVESSEASSFFDYTENTVEDDDEYPSEILEQIVEDTYKLLKSDDEEEKRKLKISRSHYSYYLQGPRIAEPEKIPSRKKSGKRGRYLQEGCSAKTALLQPRRATDDSGTEYYIVNVKNFTQYVKVSKCVDRDRIQSCGNELTSSLRYESKCEQIIERVGLMSIPVGKPLLKENQDIYYVPFETKCSCIPKRIREEESKGNKSAVFEAYLDFDRLVHSI